MRKGRYAQNVIAVSAAAILAALLGSGLYLVKERGGLGLLSRQFFPSKNASPEPGVDRDSRVLPLVAIAPEQRRPQLEEIAASPDSSYDRSRARYLLASDWIEALEGGNALRALEGLDREYPILAPMILLKRARAYELTNDLSKSRQVLEKLVKEYPDSLVTAEALYKLGKGDPENHELALTKFPTHPIAHQIAIERLDRDPNQLPMLLFLARNAPEIDRIGEIRDRLVQKFGPELAPQDWEVIADGYWEARAYRNAAVTYSKLPNSAKSLYRIARGSQLVGDTTKAISTYQILVNAFPQAEETGRALLHLANLSPQPQALTYLSSAVDRFPDLAPTALKRKADLHEKLKQGQLEAQTRQILLDNYPNSDETAEYRWKIAKQLASAGNYAQAWKWARPIAANTSDSAIAPKAAFWVGKWAAQLNRSKDAQSAFEYVLTKYPTSYYAWRSAAILGWDVGNFNTVRSMTPEVVNPTFRPAPPAGSEMFKELYQLGQNGDAQELFQAEVGNRELTVPERFTKALFVLAQGQYQQGIAQILDLRKLEEPQAKEEWKALRKDPQYWQALFPFPYEQEILKWSAQRKINPLLVVSLMRQESRFQKDIRSPVGATGLMQVMPATGQEVAKKIGLTQYSLTNPEDNVAIGTAYLDYTHEQYANNSLMAIASYNAGPGNVSSWLQRFNPQDPDSFVEQIPFAETQGYVESVFSNYWNYLRIYNPEIAEKLSL
ncbi:transglycosylase SLT domain-containing protein [Oscillatoria sp. FACHB-1406]|uniref:transglycosylase SLT domain-containing protein n=1 Tax=Oscillatoria sp. FACHB-1406 TaxID=2692846 RepID=UPI00168962AD|nr:transglycosylase SLT domain-containing protein [Oscillatoria sp. FACHB-1406]MBD2577628.1 transglycosylase SLT domain-containing protein [Oscillatoria sp. FACHB-1406]